MKLRIILIGKTKQSWVKPAVEEYRKRCSRYIQLEELVLAEAKGEPGQVRQREGEALMKTIGEGAFLIALDERGNHFTSPELANKWKEIQLDGKKEVCIVVGGAFGLSEEIRKRANLTLALSKLTFPHQFVRAILYEQLYRVFTIIKGEPYHH